MNVWKRNKRSTEINKGTDSLSLETAIFNYMEIIYRTYHNVVQKVAELHSHKSICRNAFSHLNALTAENIRGFAKLNS